jgi:hypothetical protein
VEWEQQSVGLTPRSSNEVMKSLPNFFVTPASTAHLMGRRQSAWAVPSAPPEELQQMMSAKRRKSWHHKLERRRRKGVVVAVGGTDPHAVAAVAAIADLNTGGAVGAYQPPPLPGKQKRKSSWWNIFGSDHWPR